MKITLEKGQVEQILDELDMVTDSEPTEIWFTELGYNVFSVKIVWANGKVCERQRQYVYDDCPCPFCISPVALKTATEAVGDYDEIEITTNPEDPKDTTISFFQNVREHLDSCSGWFEN